MGGQVQSCAKVEEVQIMIHAKQSFQPEVTTTALTFAPRTICQDELCEDTASLYGCLHYTNLALLQA